MMAMPSLTRDISVARRSAAACCSVGTCCADTAAAIAQEATISSPRRGRRRGGMVLVLIAFPKCETSASYDVHDARIDLPRRRAAGDRQVPAQLSLEAHQ